MAKLLTQIAENIQFLAICLALIAALAWVTALLEKKLLGIRPLPPARRVSIIALCAALACVLHMLDFPLPFLAPDFYKLDFSEVPVLLCGFYLGPTATIACEGLKILLKLLFKSTSTAFVGDFANFLVGCSFVLPAVLIYHRSKSKTSAIVGLTAGGLCLVLFGTAFNAVYLLPQFAKLYGIPMESILAMGSQIWGGITDVTTFVFYCVAPLNGIKAISVSVLTLLLYKRVERPLFGTLSAE